MSDFISRQDAISAVVNTSIPFCTFGKKSREYNALKRDAVYAIKALPSVEPVGKWVEDGYYDYPYYVCSNCGQGCWVQNNGVEIEPLRTKYCPNCGAKMKGSAK